MTESQLVADGLAAYERACQDRIHFQAQAESWERSATIANAENESLKAQLIKAQSELGYYMRHSTELKTLLEATAGTIQEVLVKARQGAYRGGGILVQGGAGGLGPGQITELGSNDPVPSFLTRERAQAIEEALR